MNKKILTPREKLFCCCMAQLANPTDAAIVAGYAKAKAFAAATRLLEQSYIRRYIDKIRDRQSGRTYQTARAALTRLAFGRSNDAILLALSDEMPDNVDTLDLFGVSEIKKVKGGGVEVKLTSRLDAIRLLYELESQSSAQTQTDSFFTALQNTSPALTEGDEVREE